MGITIIHYIQTLSPTKPRSGRSNSTYSYVEDLPFTQDREASLTRNQPPLLSLLHTYEQLAFSFLDDIKGFWRLKK